MSVSVRVSASARVIVSARVSCVRVRFRVSGCA